MQEVRVTGFNARNKDHVRRIMRSMGFRLSSRKLEDEIAGNPAGARLSEVADLILELEKLNARIKVDVHDL